MEHTSVLCRYDVALWLTWRRSPWPEHVGYVLAMSPLLAVFSLMQAHSISRVVKAAVCAEIGVISRWYNVECPVEDEEEVSSE